MKKLLLLSLVLALLLPLALASCGGGEVTTPAATTPPAATTTEAPATTTAPPVTGGPTVTPGDDASRPLFTLNLSATLPSNVGKYDVEITAQSTLERFLAARAELPEEVTVLERVSVDDYPASAANVLYVAKSGSDENPGTKEAPLASLAAAVAKMKNKEGGIIYLMEGSYSVDKTVTLSASHSGTLRSPLFIKAYEDDEVTLTSNLVLSNDEAKWQKIAESDAIYDRLPEASRDKVIRTSLADHGLTAEDIAKIDQKNGPPRLYVDGAEYSIARYPNDTGNIIDLLYFTKVYDSGTVTADTCLVYWPWVERCQALGKDPMTWIVGWELRIPTEDARGQEIMTWVNTGDIWYYGSTYSGWEFGYYNIALETEGQAWAHNADGTAWVPGSGETPYVGYPKGDGDYSLKSVHYNAYGAMPSTNSPAGRNTFYLFNAVEAMDIPGEWFLDRKTDTLYLIPEEGFFQKTASFSSGAKYDLFLADGTKNLVIDGIKIDGVNGYGIKLNNVKDAVFQNLTVMNTLLSSIYVSGTTERTAIIHSDFSRAYDTMIKCSLGTSFYNLDPSDVVIQNNIFHDAMPTYQNGVALSGCRMVVSHNYFHNTIVGASSLTTECIVEYNRFEGGSADVTDGGMIYTWGVGHRGNHYRYNLIHMFNATHNAIYNDGTSSHHYAYGNMISFLGSKSNLNKAWYSSTGLGNVFFGNTVVLRNPMQVAAAGSPGGYEGDIKPSKSGDQLNESGLFYYYFGDEHAGTGAARYYTPVAYDGTPQLSSQLYQSEAGHWWVGMKEDEQTYYITRGDEEKWAERDPQFMNLMEGTKIVLGAYANSDYHPKYFYVPWYLTGKTYTHEGIPAGTLVQIPQYTYLDATGKPVVVPAHCETVGEDGSLTLTYEEVAAMERFRRQPGASVVTNNVILGGTPTKDKEGNFTETLDPAATITNGCDSYQGFVKTTLVDKNYYNYHYADVLWDAENYNYDIFPYMYDEFAEIMDEDGLALIEDSLWYDSGLTFEYDYSIWS
ncbi:MAG: right-handed parallel beta-helix repeat-containing protein [Clostridia bacterium]|nr:right-handed parallel beta-helix repeat-containing protein [Clostridia bacterium]